MLIIMMLASALARTAREDVSDARDARGKQLQGNKRIVAAEAVVAVQI